MTKNIYFTDATWELFELFRSKTGLSRGEFIHLLLKVYVGSPNTNERM